MSWCIFSPTKVKQIFICCSKKKGAAKLKKRITCELNAKYVNYSGVHSKSIYKTERYFQESGKSLLWCLSVDRRNILWHNKCANVLLCRPPRPIQCNRTFIVVTIKSTWALNFSKCGFCHKHYHRWNNIRRSLTCLCVVKWI